MLQAESLVSACAGGSIDRKITCETLADNDHNTDPPERHPDSPPESFWLSKDEEHDWFDRNAHAIYERKESTKGSISNSNSTSSQRFSLNLKSRIIGLPKPQKPSFTDAKNRRNHCNNVKLFPKRSVSVTKSVSSHAEPSSPKVSCMGRVRSKRDRSRSLRLRDSRNHSSTHAGEEIPARIGRKHGFFERFRAIFRSGQRKKHHRETDRDAEDSTVRSSVVKARDSTASVNDAASFAESISGEPPGLGGMMRFASGRRSESWGVGDSEIHVSR